MSLPWRLLILFIVLIWAYCWKSSQLIIAPKRFIFPYNPSNFGLQYEFVKLTTSDSITLDAWFIPADSSRGTIITCHGYGSSKGDCIDIARFLVPQNYNVLAFDFREHGKSGGKYTSLGHYETEDIESAIRWLVGRGEDKIGAIGFSMGGTALLKTLASNPELKAVVSDGAYISFNSAVVSFAKSNFKAPKYPFIPPAIWTARLRLKFNPKELDLAEIFSTSDMSDKSVLIIHGGKDREIPVRNAKAIFSVLKCDKELWIIPEAHHLESHYIAGEEYEDRVIKFFDSVF